MKLIIGLGNPGKKYEKTRHNTGFMVLDELQLELKAAAFGLDKKFQAEVAEARFNEEKLILAKPQTYMNESGQAVRSLIDYYHLKPADIRVIYDDLDLPLGKIRIGQFNSAGGHKGIESIIDHLKSTDFVRFRVGIGNSHSQKATADLPALRRQSFGASATEAADQAGQAGKFVLQKFGILEKKKINEAIKQSIEAIKMVITEPLEKVINKYN